MDLRPAFLSVLASAIDAFRWQQRLSRDRRRRWLRDRDLFDWSTIALEEPLQHLAPIGEQMPAIRDLDRGWCPKLRSRRIGFGAVACDDGHARMGLQPGGKGLRRAIGQ